MGKGKDSTDSGVAKVLSSMNEHYAEWVFFRRLELFSVSVFGIMLVPFLIGFFIFDNFDNRLVDISAATVMAGLLVLRYIARRLAKKHALAIRGMATDCLARAEKTDQKAEGTASQSKRANRGKRRED